MNPSILTCTACGFRFDPAEHPGCASCPVHSGCATACCPNCGTSNINPSASRLARWVERLFNRKQPSTQAGLSIPGGFTNPDTSTGLTLDQVRSGRSVRVAGFGAIGAEQSRHLQAYGVLPGRKVKVLAQKPMTVLQIEQTELAIETIVAKAVRVEEIQPPITRE